MSTTSADHHVQAIVDLLEAASDGEWTTDPPEVYRYWDRAQSERGPGADQPPHLYVWSPTSSQLEQFSMDGTKFDQTDTVEIHAWTLNDVETRQLQADVTRILSAYLDDNTVETPYSTVEPIAESDFREQTPARSTDHYIMGVEIEPRGLSDTGLA